MNNNNSFDRLLNTMTQNLEILHELEHVIVELESSISRDICGRNGSLNVPPATSNLD